MPHLLVFGLGYTASRLAAQLAGWRVTGTSRAALPLTDPRVAEAIATATHILSSVPPDAAGDPVLAAHGAALAAAPARWLGYLSSTGVYGDAGGAWVDESAPVGTGRRSARAAADAAWRALRPDVRIFRLPGIYGPGRSALDRVAAGTAVRVDAPNLFSRVHVDDIVAAVRLSFDRPPGVWNLADDAPASPNAVADHAAALLGRPRPPLVPLASLSPPAAAFYAERRLVAAGRARRELGWRPAYPDYRAGLAACLSAAP